MSRVRPAERPALLVRLAHWLLRRAGKPENAYLHAIAHSSRLTNAELTAQITYGNHLARFSRAFDLPASGRSGAGVCPIPDHLAPGAHGTGE